MINNARSFIALENLIDFIMLCADRKKSRIAANEIFMVSDCEDISLANLLKNISQAYEVVLRLYLYLLFLSELLQNC